MTPTPDEDLDGLRRRVAEAEERARLRDRLAEVGQARRAARQAARDHAALMREARAGGITITEIARLTGCSRQTVYNTLAGGG